MKAGDLDADLWLSTGKTLASSVKEAFTINEIDSNSYLISQLQENLYAFTAFKNHNNIKDMVNLLTDANGNKRSFAEFKKEAIKLNKDYNVNWLRTEYNHAVGSARMAGRWAQYEARGGKLKYLTVRDGRVRPDHAELHGTIMPVNDPFWDTYYPPNDWGCRCYVQWVSDENPDVEPKGLPTMKPGFDVNPGKAGKVYTQEHPYIRTLNSVEQQRVKQNLEQLKEMAPYELHYQNPLGAQLRVSPFADKRSKEVYDREYAGAIKTVKQLNIPIDLKVFLRNGNPQPDYISGNLLGEHKQPSNFKKLGKRLTEAQNQGANFVIINFDKYQFNPKFTIFDTIHRQINDINHNSFEFVIIEKGKKVVLLTKDELYKTFDYADKLGRL